MSANASQLPRICFFGLGNLSFLTRAYEMPQAGGAELQQALLAKALAKRGWPVSMVVADFGQPNEATWDGVRTFKAYRLDEGIPVLRFLHPRWTKLWSALRRADADIYYTSCAGGHLAQIVLFAHRHGRKAAFRVASNSDCDPSQLLVRYWRDKVLYRYGLARADLVLAQTSQQQQALRQNYRRQSRLTPSLFERAARHRGFEERDIDVLWVGNIRQVKRPDLLLEAARRLPRLRFHMVGGPLPREERLYEAIRREAAGLDNVSFLGPVPYQDVQPLYERARLLVGTSDVEGFPNTYLQAWAHGTPVVAFLDPDGLLRSQGLGRPVASLEEMCAAIAELHDDRAEWERAAARARDYLEQRWPEEKVLAPYLAALTEMHERPPARGSHAIPQASR